MAIFDTRTLHAGTANRCSLRVLFNITFRNPKATEKIGHKGSMRPGYKVRDAWCAMRGVQYAICDMRCAMCDV